MLRLQHEELLSRKQEQDQKLEELAALFSSSAQKLKEIQDVDAASMLMRLPPGLEEGVRLNTTFDRLGRLGLVAGLRVAPQALSVTFLGLSCFCGGLLTLVLCPRLGLMVVGCVLGMTRRPFFVSRRRIRFFVRGVVRCLSSCVLGR